MSRFRGYASAPPRHAASALGTHRQAAQGENIREKIHLTGQRLYRIISPAVHHRDSGHTVAPTSGTRREHTWRNPSHGSASLQDHPPRGTPPRLWAHCLITSDRRTLPRGVYLVFRPASVLTGLGGSAQLYQAIWPIGTRPFYQTPGAILPKATSFGSAKHLRGAIRYRALRGLLRPRAVILLACIPEKPTGAPDGYPARVLYWTLLLAAIRNKLPRAVIHRDTTHRPARHAAASGHDSGRWSSSRAYLTTAWYNNGHIAPDGLRVCVPGKFPQASNHTRPYQTLSPCGDRQILHPSIPDRLSRASFVGASLVPSTCPFHTNSGCGKERCILISSW